MTLEPGSGSRLQQKGDEMGLNVFVAGNVPRGQNVSFRLSGTGSAPPPQEDSAQQQGGAPNANRPGGGIGTPINSPDPLSKYRWWIIAAVALAMVAGAGYVMSRGEAPAKSVVAAGPSLQEASKEELFALESEKINGKISDREYVEARAGLERLM